MRMQKVDNTHESLSYQLFEETLKHLKKNKSEKYKFIIKSGPEYKEALFKLFQLVWNKEEKPDQWNKDFIIQLYKGSGPKDQFKNLRNIHTKADIPKFFENMVLNAAKSKIVSGTSKFQIGAIP